MGGAVAELLVPQFKAEIAPHRPPESGFGVKEGRYRARVDVVAADRCAGLEHIAYPVVAWTAEPVV